MAEFSWTKKYAAQADTFPDELLRVATSKGIIAPSSASLLMEVRSVLIGENTQTNVAVLADACAERARVSNTFKPHFEDAVRALQDFNE